MADAVSLQTKTDALAETLIRRAAVVGAFDPLDLLPRGVDPSTATDLLARLGKISDEVAGGAGVLWRLADDPRRAVLETLETRRHASKLVSEAPAAEADLFGRALQNALVGRAGRSKGGGSDDIELAARNFAVVAPYARDRREADPRPVRNEIVARARVERSKVVLPTRLYGRTAQKRAIEAFLRGEQLPRRWQSKYSGDGFVTRALLVTGVGGVGKSALMAAIIRDARRRKNGPPIAIVDFDRPNLFRGDRIEILREITRQLGETVPELEGQLAEARGRIGEDLGARLNASASLLLETVALDALRAALVGLTEARRKAGFAVVLDTFEEVATRGAEEVARVLGWLQSIEACGLTPLRIVVSGRAEPELSDREFSHWFAGHIALGGLRAQAGAALLRGGGERPEMFVGQRGLEAARAFQGQPLVLKFLQRYAADHEAGEIDALITEALESPTFPPDFAQVFLFTRILGRIRNEDIRRLAHPGLVLRRVTPKLIQQVLAGPCGFGVIDEPKARKLFEQLRSTAWIIERDPDPNVLRHRRDLRRLMLPAMMKPKEGDEKAAELRDKAFAIHRAAADWYGRGADPALSATTQELEAFYHGACAGDDLIDRMELTRRCTPQLGEDLGDLPPRARGLAKIAMEQLDRVTDAELAALPTRFQDRVASVREKMALSRGQTRKVARSSKPPTSGGKPVPPQESFGSHGLESFVVPMPEISEASSSAEQSPPASFNEADRRFGRELDALWQEADFEGVSEVGERAFGRLWQDGSQESLIETKEDPIHLGVWKYLLSLLVSDRWPEALSARDATSDSQHIYRPQLNSGDVLLPWTLHNAAIVLAWRATPYKLPGSYSQHPMRAGWEHVPDQLVRAQVQSDFTARTTSLGTAAAAALEQGVREPVYSAEVLRLFSQPMFESLTGFGNEVANRFPLRSGLPQVTFPPYRGPDNHMADPVRKFAGKLAHPSGVVDLADIAALSATAPSLRVEFSRTFGASVYDVGMRLPELHGPSLQALRMIEDGPQLISRLDLARYAPVWPRDIERLADNPRDADRLYATLIDLADQNGILGRLLDEVREMSPDPTRLDAIRALAARLEWIFNAPLYPETGSRSA